MPDHTDGTDRLALQMGAWFSQRPVFALMGEFSAGKSTLLNVLLGQSFLPARVTATKLPLIWLTHGPALSWQGFGADGHADPIAHSAPSWDMLENYALVRMTHDSPLLERCDVVDTPGISDPRIAVGSLRIIEDFIDFAVWCTAANQAWRQSEKAAWKMLPEGLRENSLLAVTRTDQLDDPASIGKVIKRLQKETGPLFGGIHPVSSTRALSANAAGATTDMQVWRDSGAAELLKAIRAAVARAQTACDARDTVEMEPATGDPKAVAPATELSEDDAKADLRAQLSKLQADIASSDTKAKLLATIEHAVDLLRAKKGVDDTHLRVLVAGLSTRSLSDLAFERVKIQLEQEVADFTKGAWCRLNETETRPGD
ncbi:dynamin family protein [Loktanella agnita]|uniref:dynamin family protein n=1 Tax=Loktanella agnita TaxID=287097 RepID=UPI0039889ABA